MLAPEEVSGCRRWEMAFGAPFAGDRSLRAEREDTAEELDRFPWRLWLLVHEKERNSFLLLMKQLLRYHPEQEWEIQKKNHPS